MSGPKSFIDKDALDKQHETAINKFLEKNPRIVPTNELDAMFLTIDPDYQSTIEALGTERYALILKAFKSGFRLGNLSPTQTALCEYEFQIASDCFDLGLETSAVAFLSDITARCEFSQSKKGFRVE